MRRSFQSTSTALGRIQSRLVPLPQPSDIRAKRISGYGPACRCGRASPSPWSRRRTKPQLHCQFRSLAQGTEGSASSRSQGCPSTHAQGSPSTSCQGSAGRQNRKARSETPHLQIRPCIFQSQGGAKVVDSGIQRCRYPGIFGACEEATRCTQARWVFKLGNYASLLQGCVDAQEGEACGNLQPSNPERR